MAGKLSEASDGRLDAILDGPGGLPSSKPIFATSTKHATSESADHRALMRELCCTVFGHTVLDRIVAFFAEDYDRFPFPARDWRSIGVCDTVDCPGY